MQYVVIPRRMAADCISTDVSFVSAEAGFIRILQRMRRIVAES